MLLDRRAFLVTTAATLFPVPGVAADAPSSGGICAALGAVVSNRHPCITADGTNVCKGVVKLGAIWRQKRELHIAFVEEGNADVREEVMRAASEWSRHANLRFVPSSVGASDIRVSLNIRPAPEFGSSGHSYVGEESHEIAKRQGPNAATMNLVLGSDQRHRRRVVLHEFGHAIGLDHEHLSPHTPIVWDEEAVIRDAASTFGWAREKTQYSILDRIPLEKLAQATEFDPQSIMIYPIPPHWTRNGVSTPYTYELSQKDRWVVGWGYPGAGALNAAETYARGLEAYENGRFAEAADLWLQSAKTGHTDSQIAYGYLAHVGRLTGSPDFRTAASWYRAAAEAGSAPAMVSLGLLYAVGLIGNGADIATARRLFEAAAARGSAEGMYQRANLAELDANPQEALRWHGDAACAGHPVSQAWVSQAGKRPWPMPVRGCR